MIKQVIAVRMDIKMDKGKMAVQVAHASLGAYRVSPPESRKIWESGGEKKVVLKVPGLKELLELKRMAGQEGLPVKLVRDAGKTQLEPGTVTALGIGPAESGSIDTVTGRLKLA